MKTMKMLTKDELDLDPELYPQVNKWLERGDGIAVYENHDFGSATMGHRQFVSYGSPSAMLEVDVPPQRLPDIGNAINWRFQLIGVYRGELL
jgi:hypothetical protein